MYRLAYHISPFFFFFNDTATTEIYTLSLHDALPISSAACYHHALHETESVRVRPGPRAALPLPLLGRRARASSGSGRDRKSTRLNSSHQIISYAVFCLKKKKQIDHLIRSDTIVRVRH